MPRTRRVVRNLLLVTLAFAGSPLSAQDARLVERLGPAATRTIGAIVDSARAENLPTEPLIQKALEGQSKGASDVAIEFAVRHLRDRMATARAALGSPLAGELVAAAAVLDMGADAAALARLRSRRPSDSLAAALVGLAFLLQRGVPVASSVDIVQSLLDARMNDDDFATLQRLIEQDIRAGAPAMDAATTRARALIVHRVRSAPRSAPW